MNKLTSKEILTAVLCIIVYAVLLYAGGFAGFVSPLLWVSAPVISAFLGAFPMTYLTARVRRPFIAFGTALFCALVIFITGESDPAAIIFPIAVGIIAEVIHKLLGYDTIKGIRFGYSVLSLIAFAPIISLWTDTETYISAAAEEMGDAAYGETLRSFANAGILALIIILTLIIGYASTFISGAVFKKLFKNLH